MESNQNESFPSLILIEETEVKIKAEADPETEELLNLANNSNNNLTTIGSCENCGQSFKLRQYLLAHKFKCSSKSTQKSQISASRSKYKYNYHRNTTFACEYCFQKFSDSFKYRKHQVFTLGQTKDKTQLICKQCGTESLVKCQAKTHTREQTCEKCALVFSCEQVYSEHISNGGACEQQLEKWEYINCTGPSGYPCVRCLKVYPNIVSWRVHNYGHDDYDRGKEFHCSVPGCAKVFRRRNHLTKHQTYHFGRRRTYTCEKCGIELRSKGGYYSHRKIKDCQNKFKGGELVKSQISASSRSKWIKHNYDPNATFACEYCFQKFSNSFTYRRHQAFTLGQTKDKTRLDCKQCGTESLVKCQAKIHTREQTCEKCTLIFTCEQVYSEHISSLCEQQREKWEYINCNGLSCYPCVRCLKVYPTFASWKAHSYGHDEQDRGKEFYCPAPGCAKVFRRRNHLTKHQACHLDTRRTYTCEKCGIELSKGGYYSHRKIKDCQNKFKGGDDVAKHIIRKSRGRRGIRIYPCPYCEQVFYRFKRNLHRHLKLMLPKIEEKQKFTCEYCQTSFEAKCMLTKHLTVQKCPREGCPYKTTCSTVFKDHKDNCKDSDGMDLQNDQDKTRQMLVEKIPQPKITAKVIHKETKNSSKDPLDFDPFTLSCPYCQEIFGREGALQRHLDLNRGGGSGSCSKCDQPFEFRCQQIHHICKCNQESESLCIRGSISIIKNEPLNPNLEETNLDVDPGGPFWCWACKVSFNQKTMFFEHIRNIHNEEPE